MKIILPFLMPGLNEYIEAERSNRHKAAKMKRYWQSLCKTIIELKIKKNLKEPIFICYHWVEKNRRRDKDNISSFGRKVFQDALVQSGKIKNDGWSNIEGFTDVFSVDAKNPRVEIFIEQYRKGE